MEKPLILLYQPKTDATGAITTMPYSLLAISAVIDVKKVDIQILEGALIPDLQSELLSVTRGRRLLLAGTTVITGPPVIDALNFTRCIKKISPVTPVIWGGFHPSIAPEVTLNDADIDFIVKGQGEVPFRSLVECLLEDKSYEHIAGLGFKKDSKVFVNYAEPPQNINEFPSTPFHLIDIKKYNLSFAGFGLYGNGIVYITSQGCPFNCKFCSDSILYQRRWSGFSVDRMMTDIRMFYTEYKITSFLFFDNNFFVNPKRILDLCEKLISEGIRIKWYADIRIDQINKFTEEQLKLIKKAGADIFLVGAESGSDDILKLVNKMIVKDDTLNAARKCRNCGIEVIYSCMTGFPEVYREEFDATLSMVEQLRDIDPTTKVIMCVYTPYPGTELFEKYKHLITIPQSLEQWGLYSVHNINTTWMDAKHMRRIRRATFYIEVALSTMDRCKVLMNYAKNHLWFGLFYYPFHRLAVWRLRKKCFRFNIEQVLFEFILNIAKKIFPGRIKKMRKQYQ